MVNPFEAIEVRLSVIEAHLISINTTVSKNQSQDKEDTIDVIEVAKILHLSVATIYTKTSKKQIPFMKQGKRLIFSRREIYNYLAEGKVKTIKEEIDEQEALRVGKISMKLKKAS